MAGRGRAVEAMTSGAPAVSLRGVSIAYRISDGQRYEAVRPVDLDIADRSFVAIVGPTGCGKSTLLNVIAGLIAPTSGAVAAFGAAVDGVNRRAGYLFQLDALMPWKTALDNVAVALAPL